jgi:hypothetical protein
MSNMYRIVLACKGVPADVGAAGARDISEEFKRRPWHQHVTCEWNGSQLILQADNDFDPSGRALVDEYSDAISAYISVGFDGDTEIVSAAPLPSGVSNSSKRHG